MGDYSGGPVVIRWNWAIVHVGSGGVGARSGDGI